jgi:hypothetical protein
LSSKSCYSFCFVVVVVVVEFVRAWIESAIAAESLEMDCHVRIVHFVVVVVDEVLLRMFLMFWLMFM